jgi:hypothetical protein
MKINDILNEEGKGLWANIHAKRKRIKNGSGEKMRKPGSKGAPTAQNFKDAASESIDQPAMPDNKFNSMMSKMTSKKSLNSREALAMIDELVYHGGASYEEALEQASNSFEIDQDVLDAEYRKHASNIELDEDEDVAEGILEESYDGDEFYEAYGDLWYDEEMLNEAEYQGRKVQLGKPMRGDVKKFKVYVKNEKGNVVKVNFGDPNMKIRKSNPKARKSFRARHNCANPGPRTKARYWSCRKW